jgi:hypothetical protein
MPEGVGEGRVDAQPEKRFFVDMLTRDIELAPAIIDLVDNSIDGAKRLRPDEDDDQRFDGLSVQMRLEPELFEILDTCGGFSRSHAASYAFKFGRHRDQPDTPGEVGQFGVGMKRAIFKLGRQFTVASTTDDDSWKVEVEVDTWLDDAAVTDWTFPLADGGEVAPDTPGTLVRCTKLLPAARTRLGQDGFVSRVLREIAMRHALALQQGLAIEVNGMQLQPRPPFLLASDSLQPISYGEVIENGEGQALQMRIAAGFATADDTDEETDTDDPDLFTGSNPAGWYVFCNGRALLFADRSRLTGWGDEVPRFHPQFRRFRGYVYLSGDSAAMPWNTAKTHVDEDSEVWEQTRKHIVDVLRKSIAVMNRMKREVQQRPPEDRPLFAALKSSKPEALDALSDRRTFELPAPPPKIVADSKKISYSVPTDVFAQASQAMETDRPSEIGQRTFAYWMRREVDESFDG